MAMGHKLCLHFGADEQPCSTYFDVHQGFPEFLIRSSIRVRSILKDCLAKYASDIVVLVLPPCLFKVRFIATFAISLPDRCAPGAAPRHAAAPRGAGRVWAELRATLRRARRRLGAGAGPKGRPSAPGRGASGSCGVACLWAG